MATRVLVEFAAEGLALSLVTLLAVAMLSRSSAGLRRDVLTVAMAVASILPVITLAHPVWSLSLLSVNRPTEVTVATGSLLSGPAPASRPRSEPGSNGPQPATDGARSLPDLASLAPWLWALGALLVLGNLTLAGTRARRLVKRSRAVEEGVWAHKLRELADEMGLERPLRLLENDDVTCPVVVGVVRPNVVVPASALSWGPDRADAVLRHELAHVACGDLAATRWAALACAVHWMNPLAWWGLRRMIVERERAADDSVLVSGMKVSAYAEHLLALSDELKKLGRRPRLDTAAIVSGHDFRARMLYALDPFTNRSSSGMSSRGRMIGLGVLMVIPFLLVTPLTAVEATSVPVESTMTGSRQTSVNSSGQQQDIAALAPIVDGYDRARSVRAVWALAEIHDVTAHGVVVRALSHRDPGVGNAAANAIQLRWSPDEAIPILTDAIDSPIQEVAVSAVWCLSRIEDARARQSVRAALNHPSAAVSNAASGAIASWNGGVR